MQSGLSAYVSLLTYVIFSSFNPKPYYFISSLTSYPLPYLPYSLPPPNQLSRKEIKKEKKANKKIKRKEKQLRKSVAKESKRQDMDLEQLKRVDSSEKLVPTSDAEASR